MRMQQKKSAGFTLVELAIAVMVIGLLVGSGITLLTRYMQQVRVKQAQADMEMIVEALVGYIYIHNHLPCPDTDAYPPVVGVAWPATGSENRAGLACAASQGYLPATDLGVPGLDPWGMRYFYNVDVDFANNTGGVMSFGLGDLGDITVLNTGAVTVVADGIPALILSTGPNKAFTLALASDDEDENIDGGKDYISKPFTPADAAGAEFDDLIKWIPPAVLMSRMVDAGKLPL